LDLNKSSDPFITFSGKVLLTDEKTTTIFKNLNPQWPDNEVPVLKLAVNAKERLRVSYIAFKVFDDDYVRNEIMAAGLLSLEAAIEAGGKPAPFVLPLTRAGLPCGTVSGEISVTWDAPNAQLLSLDEARNTA